jgi:TPR repeat protein
MAQAARWYGRAAAAGHDWAQYNLGHLHLNGLGVARDPAAALYWYRRAADQGHARAMNLVARCLEEGWGAPADPAAANDWRRRSAEGGYFRGQYNHAVDLAEDGRIEEAAALFKRALDGAPPDTRRRMAKALRAHAEPALKALGQEAAA